MLFIINLNSVKGIKRRVIIFVSIRGIMNRLVYNIDVYFSF